MQLRLWISAMALVLTSGAAVAQTAVIALMPDQVNWGPAPGLPADWQAAVVMGDPAKAGAYVDAFMEAINWDNAVKLYERVSRDG